MGLDLLDRIARDLREAGHPADTAAMLTLGSARRWADGDGAGPELRAAAAIGLSEWRKAGRKPHPRRESPTATPHELAKIAARARARIDQAEGVLMGLATEARQGAVDTAKALAEAYTNGSGTAEVRLSLDRRPADPKDANAADKALREAIELDRRLALLEQNPQVAALMKLVDRAMAGQSMKAQGAAAYDVAKYGSGNPQDFEQKHPRGAGGKWVAKGDSGPPVNHLQNRLNHLGYGTTADGKFGPRTEHRVKQFQSDHNLKPDGAVGPKTTQALQTATPKDDSTAAGAGSDGYGDKFRGAAGAGARAAQNKELTGKADLSPGAKGGKGGGKGKGRGHSGGGGGGRSGGRGGAGRGGQGGASAQLDVTNPAAVRKFQQEHGLRPDGLIGPRTMRAMRDAGIGGHAGSQRGRGRGAGAHKGASAPIIAKGLGIGDARGNTAAREVQNLLNQVGFDPGPKDGRVGPRTEKAIKRFQRRYGLKPDGIVGPKTRKALEMALKTTKGGRRGLREQLEEAVLQRATAAREGNSDAWTGARARELELRRALEEADAKGDGMMGGGEMKRCPSCGWRNPIGATKCKKCGADLRKKGDAKAPSPQEAAALDEAADSLIKASTPEPFSTSRTSNWVARVGGLPAYIQHIAHDLMEKRGKTESNAIQMAIGIVKRWAKGVGNVTATTRAAASKAVAEWEAKKAAAHSMAKAAPAFDAFENECVRRVEASDEAELDELDTLATEIEPPGDPPGPQEAVSSRWGERDGKRVLIVESPDRTAVVEGSDPFADALALEELFGRGGGTIHFDPAKHPRGRGGKFARVLGSLHTGQKAKLPGNITVKRKDSGFEVKGFGKTEHHADVASAASAALDKHDANSWKRGGLVSGRGRDDEGQAAKAPPATPGGGIKQTEADLRRIADLRAKAATASGPELDRISNELKRLTKPRAEGKGGSGAKKPPQTPGSTAAVAIDVGDDVDRAAQLLAEGKHVQLNQPRQVSTLLDRLADQVRKATERGDKAPDIDLCKVSVKGSNLFCAKSQGIPRVKMPQLKGVPTPGSKADALPRDERGEVDLTSQFRTWLQDRGTKITDGTERVSFLRATQNELNGAKVAGMVKHLQSGGNLGHAPTWTSQDNYIIDGHHRWAAQIGLDAMDNRLGDEKIPVSRANMGIVEMLAAANDFTNEWGLPHRGVADETARKAA